MGMTQRMDTIQQHCESMTWKYICCLLSLILLCRRRQCWTLSALLQVLGRTSDVLHQARHQEGNMFMFKSVPFRSQCGRFWSLAQWERAMLRAVYIKDPRSPLILPEGPAKCRYITLDHTGAGFMLAAGHIRCKTDMNQHDFVCANCKDITVTAWQHGHLSEIFKRTYIG
jgi:hypothetical protein